ncbi:hypothetical protein PG996_006923 [Apiospora saccharicola]|uniref:Uncharacterized protein n=1 Tax=Apiospora saccharicola TaxID=335842 RepID=A0ABR1V9D3_9PEZI
MQLFTAPTARVVALALAFGAAIAAPVVGAEAALEERQCYTFRDKAACNAGCEGTCRHVDMKVQYRCC